MTMIELLGMPFMQRAMVAGILVGGLASYYGVFVVQRGLSFVGNGLAHAAFGGVALALLLDAEPLWFALPWTVAVALAIMWVRNRTSLGPDTAVGIFFAVSMALGVVLLHMKRGFTGDAWGFLFGDILAVRARDLWVAGGVVLLSLGTLPLWGRWAYATFDRELAEADGVRVERDDYLLSVAVAVTVVVAVKVVGIVLIAAYLVIPAATARLLTRTFASMTVVSIAFGVVSAVAGLLASAATDLPSGATIILVQSGLFFIALAAHRRPT
jgi:zinc transport system permease protein